MKKRILLLSGIGIGGGLLYLLNRGARAADRSGGRTKRAAERDTDGPLRSSDIPLDDGGERSNGRATPRSSMGAPGNGKEHDNPIIDDQGTDQAEASHILQTIRDSAFESSDEKLALALGRPTEEIEEWTSGSGIIDGDVVMKARGLAIQRGIEIE